jgi:hypothetical protein
MILLEAMAKPRWEVPIAPGAWVLVVTGARIKPWAYRFFLTPNRSSISATCYWPSVLRRSAGDLQRPFTLPCIGPDDLEARASRTGST